MNTRGMQKWALLEKNVVGIRDGAVAIGTEMALLEMNEYL